MVVLAGYKDKMGRLMRAEEGLARRFPNRLDLDDYSPDELAHICEMVARTRHQREFEPGLREKLATHIQNFYWRDIAQQNAGLSVNLTEKALDRQIVRIVSTYPEATRIYIYIYIYIYREREREKCYIYIYIYIYIYMCVCIYIYIYRYVYIYIYTCIYIYIYIYIYTDSC